MKTKIGFVLIGLTSLAILFGSLTGVADATGDHFGQRGGRHGSERPRIKITVMDLDAYKPIRNGQTLASLTDFRVTVTNTGGDCAGQFVVTALGDVTSAPSALVQTWSFIIGPDSPSASGTQLDSGLENDWKVSASCNGPNKNDFDFDSFEFFVNVS
jgi:hypothetical protein